MTPKIAKDLDAVDRLRDSVVRWSAPMVEDVDNYDASVEVQVFVYFPEIPAASLAGYYTVDEDGDTVSNVVALGPSVVLLGEGVEPFFPYAVVRRFDEDGAELIYCYPVGEGQQVYVFLPADDDPAYHLVLLEVDSEVAGMAQLYFEETTS